MDKKLVKDFLFEEESYLIRGAAFDVWKTFKGIFKEKVVDNALKNELENRGLKIENQKRIDIYYKGEKVGIYIPDQIINDSILIEIKVKPYLTKEDERQFWYYLRGSKYRLGFLINFGSKRLEIKRRVYDKAREKYRNISVNQRTYQRVSASTRAGFTLVEIVVVVSIMIILSGVVLVNYKNFGDQFALQRSANQLAQDIRRAQEMAMSAKECPPGNTKCPAPGQPFSYIYGIYADYWSQQNKNEYYVLFADLDSDGMFDANNDALIEEIWLGKGIIIADIDTPPRKVSITFTPPDPLINISDASETATITLAISADLSRKKTITVNRAGLVEIK